MIRRILAAALVLFAIVCVAFQIHLESVAFCGLFFAATLLILSSKRVPKTVKTVLRILTVIAFAVLIAATGVILRGGQDDVCENPSDFVVVLGANTIGDEPDVALRERLDRALSYAAEHPTAILFVSGGQGKDEIRPEGDIMAQYLEKNGLAAERIVSEPYANNTRENLILCRQIGESMGMDTDNPVIITSDYHILRAKYIAKTLRMEPVGIVSKTENAALRASYAVRETFAFVKAYFVAKMNG